MWNRPYISYENLLPIFETILESTTYHVLVKLSAEHPTKKDRFMPTPILIYEAKVDSKKRVVLRGAKYSHYDVREMDDGTILLSPRSSVSPFDVSANTLEEMDRSMVNFRSGNTSEPIKL